MRSFRLALAAVVLAASFGAQSAFALSIDQRTGNNGSADFSDPDDKIPFPGVIGDDGKPTNNFQAQSVGNNGASFSFSPSGGQPDAFQRAQQNMQQ